MPMLLSITDRREPAGTWGSMLCWKRSSGAGPGQREMFLLDPATDRLWIRMRREVSARSWFRKLFTYSKIPDLTPKNKSQSGRWMPIMCLCSKAT